MNPIVSVNRNSEYPVIIVKKLLTDEETRKLEGYHLKKSHPKVVIRENCDVYNEDGKLLLKFRKKFLNQTIINETRDLISKVPRSITLTRYTACGGFKNNSKIGVAGFMENWTPPEKKKFKLLGIPFIEYVKFARETTFSRNFANDWKEICKFLQEINRGYKFIIPEFYEVQMKDVNSSPFKILDTVFSTLTVNKNFRTACHYDRGDYTKGFGNLTVLENGEYEGGYTCFPQYGVCVDVREGDFLAMDVHQIHSNTTLFLKNKNSSRIAIVAYFREGLLKRNELYYFKKNINE